MKQYSVNNRRERNSFAYQSDFDLINTLLLSKILYELKPIHFSFIISILSQPNLF